jgi:hypothetical protein
VGKTELETAVDTFSDTLYRAWSAVIKVHGHSDNQAADRATLHDLCYAQIPACFSPFIQVAKMPDLSAVIDSIDQVLMHLSQGDTTEHGAELDDLSQTARQLTGGKPFGANATLGKMQIVFGDMLPWTGAAAEKFRDNFAAPFNSIVHNQFLIVSILQRVIRAEKAVWESAIESATDIANKGTSAAGAIGALNCQTNSFSPVLTTAAAIAQVLAVIPGVAPVEALTLTVVGSVAAVASLGTPISSGSPTTIFNGVKENIHKLTNDVDTKLDQIQSCLTGINKGLPGSTLLFESRRPDLANAKSEDQAKNDMGNATS